MPLPQRDRLLTTLVGSPVGGAAALAILYAAGFIVVNAHVASHFPIRPDLFRAQYLAAAANWIVLTALPAISVGLIWRNHIRGDLLRKIPSKVPHRMRSMIVAAAYLLITIIGYGTLWMPLSVLSIDVGYFWSWTAFLYYALVCCLVWAWLFFWIPIVRQDLQHDDVALGRLSAIDHLTLILIGVLSLASSFGRTVYPNIKPQYGGGASWIGISAGTQLAPSDSVLIFDRGVEWTRILVCNDTTKQRTWRAIELRSDSLYSIEFARLSSAEDFKDHCDK